MAYFDCQIVQGGGGVILTVTCSPTFAGVAITATDGTTTLTATCPSSSPYEVEFKLPNAGTWTISGVISGTTVSTNVVIPSSAELNAIPDGATATPTDDIQTWLNCANIWDKNYTTISQVLADSATVTALIASNNAADYMARSTSWANSVTANSSAMTKIGANDYCADKLLADSTWLTAICDSTYFESVLNVKVPTMTSDTTPSGTAFADSNIPGGYAYLAFDNNASTGWRPASLDSRTSYGSRIGYIFTSPTCVKKAVFTIQSSYNVPTTNCKLRGSNDGNTWNDISDVSKFSLSNTSKTITLKGTSITAYRRIALFADALNVNNQFSSQCNSVQFYGRSS